jgi:hypothetical protein
VAGQQIGDRHRIVHVAGRDDDLIDQLRVRINRQVRL